MRFPEGTGPEDFASILLKTLYLLYGTVLIQRLREMPRHQADLWSNILHSDATRVLLDYAGTLMRESNAQAEYSETPPC